MSILIKGMEMPKNCWDCPLRNTKPCPCKGYSTALEYVTERHTDCPLVSVPPHGRLGDLDALEAKCTNEKGSYFSYEAAIIGEAVSSAPTIIPAEEEQT